MNELLMNENLDNMTDEELDLVQIKVIDRKFKSLQKRIESAENKQGQLEEELKDVKEKQEGTKTKIEKLEKETNVFCSPAHSGKRRHFMKKAAARVKFLLGNDMTTPEYVLFHSYFYQGIYSDIASKLEVGNWDDFSMEDFDKPGSLYEQAKEIRNTWKPGHEYFKKRLDELIAKRDNGILPPERCRALTIFLKATDNANNVWFL